MKDRFPPAFKRSIVREFNSQATDELEGPQGPFDPPSSQLLCPTDTE